MVFGAAWGGLRPKHEGGSPLRASAPAVLVWLAVAVSSVVQLAVAPTLLDLGQRESDAILDGQLWRLATSIVLQDGGWFGAVSNLTVLAVTLLLVRHVLVGRRLVAVFATGGIVANLLTVATFGQPGAGSSMATMVLAITALGLVQRGRLRVLALLLIAGAAVTLLVERDQHGLAAAAGLAGAVMARSRWGGQARSVLASGSVRRDVLGDRAGRQHLEDQDDDEDPEGDGDPRAAATPQAHATGGARQGQDDQDRRDRCRAVGDPPLRVRGCVAWIAHAGNVREARRVAIPTSDPA